MDKETKEVVSAMYRRLKSRKTPPVTSLPLAVTIEDVTASRTFDVNYQNTTDRPKFVTIHMLLQYDAVATLDGDNIADVYCDATATPTTKVSTLAMQITGITGTQFKHWGNMFFIVPPLYYYRIEDTRTNDASYTTISSVYEYRLL